MSARHERTDFPLLRGLGQCRPPGASRRLADERGVTSSEYLTIAGLLVVIAIAAFAIFRPQMSAAVQRLSDCIVGAVSGSYGTCRGGGGGSGGGTPAALAGGGIGGGGPLAGAVPGGPGGGARPGGSGRAGGSPASAAGPGGRGPGGAGTPGASAAMGSMAFDPTAAANRIRRILEINRPTPNQQATFGELLSETWGGIVGRDTTPRDRALTSGDGAYQQGMRNVREARDALQRGDAAGYNAAMQQAYSQFNRSNTFYRIGESQNAAMAEAAMGEAQYIHDQAKNVKDVISIGLPPGASAVADNIFRATDFVVTGEMEGYDTATKNLAVDLALSAVINKGMNALGGKSIKGAAQDAIEEGTEAAGQQITRQLRNNPALGQEIKETAEGVATQVKNAVAREGKDTVAGQIAREGKDAATGQIAREGRDAAGQAAKGQAGNAGGDALGAAGRGTGKDVAGEAAEAAGGSTAGATARGGRDAADNAASGAGASGTRGPPGSGTSGAASSAGRNIAEFTGNKLDDASQQAVTKSGILPGHGEALSDVAKARNEVILARPVNKDAGSQMINGASTKPLDIKSKSADSVLRTDVAGLIPVQSQRSKYGSELKNLSDELKGNVNPQRAAEIKNRVKDLQDSIRHQNEINKELIASGKVNVVEVNGIKVFADKNGKPMTADIDLMAISGSGKGARDVPGMGRLTGTQGETIRDINSAIGHSGGNVVQHGAENMRNLVGKDGKIMKPNIDFPLTAFQPDGKVISISDLKSMKDYFTQSGKNGYHLQPNPNWGWKYVPGKGWT